MEIVKDPRLIWDKYVKYLRFSNPYNWGYECLKCGEQFIHKDNSKIIAAGLMEKHLEEHIQRGEIQEENIWR